MAISKEEKNKQMKDYYWLNKRFDEFKERRKAINKRYYENRKEDMKNFKEVNAKLREDNAELLQIIKEMQEIINELEKSI